MTLDSQPSLQSDRLMLRPYRLKDADALQLLAGDIRVAKETLNIPHPFEDGLAEQWITSHVSQWKNRAGAFFAIERQEVPGCIGDVSFVHIHGDEAEIGYWLGVPFWHAGYCSEAGAELVKFGLAEMGLTKITAKHLTSNPRSGKVLQKIGLEWVRSEHDRDRYGDLVQFECYQTPY